MAQPLPSRSARHHRRQSPPVWTGRFYGVDFARFLAIIGMMAAHLLVPNGSPAWVQVATTGFPSTLFAVLGGFGIVFSSRRYSDPWAAFVAVFVRGLVVFLLGWVCVALPPSPIAIVLMYFGMAIMCAAFVVSLSTWIWAVLAVVLALIGPQLLPVFRAGLDTAGLLDLSNPVLTLRSLFFTGTYPVLTWLAYVLLGMILCRKLLQERQQMRSFALWLAGIGAAVAVLAEVVSQLSLRLLVAPRMAVDLGMDKESVIEALQGSQFGAMPSSGWSAALVASPHSGATMDILLTGGVAVAIIGLCLFGSSSWRAVPSALRPFFAAGAAPLTIYVTHIVMTSIMYAVLTSGPTPHSLSELPLWYTSAFWWQSAVVILIGVVLALTHRRGPLEAFTSSVSHTFADLVVERRSRAATEGRSGDEPEEAVEPVRVEEGPVEEAPVEEAPVEESPVEESPVVATPEDDSGEDYDEWSDEPISWRPLR